MTKRKEKLRFKQNDFVVLDIIKGESSFVYRCVIRGHFGSGFWIVEHLDKVPDINWSHSVVAESSLRN